MARHNKYHHKVPSSYLEGFVNEDGKLWVGDDKFNIYPTTPRKILKEKDYYTIRFPKGGGTLDVETKFLGGIEGKFASIRKDKILKHKKISDEEKAHVSIFIAAMIQRQPMQRDSLKDFFAQVKVKIEHMRNLPEETKRRLSGTSILKGDGLSFTADEVLEVAEDVDSFHSSLIPDTVVNISPIIYEMNWNFFTGEKVNYLSSDNPCKLVDPVGESKYGRGTFGAAPGLIYKDTEITLPVSSKIALVAWWQDSDDRSYIHVEDEFVKTINSRTIRNANYVISKEKTDITMLIEKAMKSKKKK